MDFTTSEKIAKLREQLLQFMDEHIYPIEAAYYRYVHTLPATAHPAMAELKAKAREQGLWNLFLPLEYGDYSPGLTNVEYAPLAQEMGKVPWASEVFNCSAPDTGNMEVLAKYGSDQQKERWLQPLLNGEIRSAFLMTEPQVASSDARNIETAIVKEGDQYRIKGTKWWSTGAAHPDCRLYVVMGKTDPTAETYRQQSIVLIPADTAGVKIIRKLPVFNEYDAPAYHCEIQLEDVLVPADHLVAGEGRGFEIAQGRLGPGRIHHCMRLIGMAERALAYMCRRVGERTTFGRPLQDHGSVREIIAQAYCDIEQARLLTLSAADKIDRAGAKAARDLIAAIKIVAPQMTCRIVDQAMQIFGGKGLSNDLPLVQFYAAARALRLADGPDEVHRYQLGRNLIRKAQAANHPHTPYFDELDRYE